MSMCHTKRYGFVAFQKMSRFMTSLISVNGFESDIFGCEIGSGFRELDAKSAQPPPPAMKLANYRSTVAGVETVLIFCGNCQRSHSYKVLAIWFF